MHNNDNVSFSQIFMGILALVHFFSLFLSKLLKYLRLFLFFKGSSINHYAVNYTNCLMNRCFAIAYLFQQNPKQSLIMKSKNIIIVSQLN